MAIQKTYNSPDELLTFFSGGFEWVKKSQWIPRFFEGKHYYFFYQGIFQDDLIFGNLVKNCFNKILGVSSWKVAW